MLRQLLSSSDNGQSTVIYPLGMNHGPSVVIVSWQRSEHGNISLRYEPCSVSCLLSSSDNGQSIVIYPYGMNHAPSVVII